MGDKRSKRAQPDHDVATSAASDYPDLMITKEVAALLRIPIKSVYDLVDMRRIPFIRLGRSLRFMRSDVLAWIAKHRVPSLE